MGTFTLLKTKFEHLKNRKLCSEELRQKKLIKFRKFVSVIKFTSQYYQKIILNYGIDSNGCLPDKLVFLFIPKMILPVAWLMEWAWSACACTEKELELHFRRSEWPFCWSHHGVCINESNGENFL